MDYFSLNAATLGNSSPERNSSVAPPPVETCDAFGDACDSHYGSLTSKDQCKNDSLMRFDVLRRFKNQGDCIQYINTVK